MLESFNIGDLFAHILLVILFLNDLELFCLYAHTDIISTQLNDFNFI